MSAGAAAHSCYMLYNGITHDETPGLPGYTAEGDVAGNSGNVAVSSVINTSARSHVELWMTGPFHAIGVLRPNLRVDRLRQVRPARHPDMALGATLDVLRGLGSAVRPADADPVPRQRHDHEPRPLRHRVTEPADLLRMDGVRRPADHRHDARGRYQRRRHPDGPERADRGLRALGSQHHRRRPTDPAGRQRRRRRAADRARPGQLQRQCQHQRSQRRLDLHRRSGGCHRFDCTGAGRHSHGFGHGVRPPGAGSYSRHPHRAGCSAARGPHRHPNPDHRPGRRAHAQPRRCWPTPQ